MANPPFVILTRQGFEDLLTRLSPAGAVLCLNPGVARPDEIAALQAAGAQVRELDGVLDPPTVPPLPALGALEGAAWIEHASPLPAPATPPAAQSPGTAPGTAPVQVPVQAPPLAPAAPLPAAPPVARGNQPRYLRMAQSARLFAGQALRRLRDAGGRNLMVLPYLGFGNAGRAWIRGRVLDEHSFREQTGGDSGWSNLVALYRRLEADEVAGARVLAHFGGQTWETVTDAGGYFSFDLSLPQPLAGGTHPVELDLPDERHPDGSPVRASAQVMVPGPGARFGIISDIDDTVLWTNVTNKLNMAWMLARTNAHTRKPFKGVAEFYRALHAGASGSEGNPLFYVSSSPWHLYGPLLDFLRLQDIPVGPLLLRELNVRDVFKLTQHGSHKLEKIELIMGFYPEMQFVLIGDSGEQDPEIYTEVVRRHPKAVRMIYIRNVNPDPARIEALDRLIDEVSTTGVQLVLAPDSVFAASHAAAEGLIAVDRLPAVRSSKKDDDGVLPNV